MRKRIEQEKILMSFEKTTFIYHDELNKYMKVEGVTSEDIFDYLFDIGVLYFCQKNKRNIYTIYSRNGIWSILNLMNILMIN